MRTSLDLLRPHPIEPFAPLTPAALTSSETSIEQSRLRLACPYRSAAALTSAEPAHNRSVAARLTVWWRGARLLTLRLDAQHPARCDSHNCRNCETRVACSHAPGCSYCEGAWGGVCVFNKVPDTGRSFRALHVFRTHHFVPATIEIVEERLSVLHDGHTYVDGACFACSRTLLPAPAHLRPRSPRLARSLLAASLNLSLVPSGLLVPGWETAATSQTWSVVFGARTSLSASDEHSVRNVRLEQGASVRENPSTVELWATGEACGGAVAEFTYYAQPVLSRVAPAQGPTMGGSVVQVLGSGLHRGTAPHCRFGGVVVMATASGGAAASALTCNAPPVAGAPSDHTIDVEVSLNGLDFTSTPAGLSSYKHTTPGGLSISPGNTAVASGGTMVVVTGMGLGGGENYLCNFGSAGTVNAYMDAGRGAVFCLAPPVETIASVVLSLELSLNAGYDYTTSGATFTYHPPPLLLSFSPSLGPSHGGTSVAIGGTFALADAWHCRFGKARVPASRSSDGGTLTCVAPDAPMAGTLGNATWALASLSFNADERPDWVTDSGGVKVAKYELRGDASVAAGVLHLTLDAPRQAGSCVLLGVRPPDGRNASAFSAVFDAQLGGACGARGESVHCGADGLSFVFGDIGADPAPFGEAGAGNGLRVLFHTHPRRRFVVMYAGAQVAAGDMNENLRAHHPQQVAVHYGTDGLWLRYGGTQLVSALVVLDWAPQGSWRFGFGARTGSLHDAHWVDNVYIVAGELGSGRGRLPLEVSTNGQQFSQAGLFYWYEPLASLASVSPNSGPRAGGTVVTIAGKFLAHGVDYRCSFGAHVVPAAPTDRASAVVCTTPGGVWIGGGGAHGIVSVNVSTNGQDFSTHVIGFFVFGVPEVTSIFPLGGPIKGGSLLNVSGRDFAAGSLPRCRFGTVLAAATVHGSDSLACESPAAVEGSVSLQISLNGQQFTANSDQFTVHGRPAVASLSPSSGPVEGGTLVRVSGVALASVSVYRCRFGEAEALATYNAAEQMLSCFSAAAVAREYCLEISLNDQDFTNDCVTFTVAETATTATASPTSGPQLGGTLVTILGAHLGGGVDYRCHFASSKLLSAASVAALYDPTDGSVSCTSPPLIAAAQNLRVTLNGQQYTLGVKYESYLEPVAVVVSPSTGPIEGGTLVTVLGTGLALGSDYRCRFGASEVAASPVSSSKANCVSPNVTAKGCFHFRVALNGQQFTATNHTFGYYGAAQLGQSSLSPSSGPSEGQTRVVVSVAHLSGGSEYICSFGAAGTVPASFIAAARQVLCFSPPRAAPRGPQPFTVALNGQQHAHSTGTFFFEGAPIIELPSPRSGPHDGGTLLTLAGTDLANGSDYSCRCQPGDSKDGTNVTAALVHTAVGSAVRCTTPPSNRKCDSYGRCLARRGEITCSVSLNGQQYSNTALFGYHDVARVSTCLPACGPVQGGALVTVHGSGFLTGTDYRCKFGGALIVAAELVVYGKGLHTRPFVKHEAAINCTLPAGVLLDGWTNRSRVLSIALNGQQFTGEALAFAVYEEPNISASSPTSGPILGGTSVHVTGNGLRGGCDYTCAFDGESVPATFNASFGVGGAILCRLPPMPHNGTTQLRVSLNGQQFSLPLLFELHAPVCVFSLSPSAGPADGATRVRLNGSHFRNFTDARCAFGTAHVRPVFGSTEIVCEAPPSPAAAGDLPVWLLGAGTAAATNTGCFMDSCGADYRGFIRKTESGHACQRWSSQQPHTHRYSAYAYPAAGLGEHAYCRNPAGHSNRTWCFTTDPLNRWDWCDAGERQPSCETHAMRVFGSASLRDEVLEFTTNAPHQFGYGSTRIFQPEKAPQPVTAFHLDFRLLMGANIRVVGASIHTTHHGSGVVVYYGPPLPGDLTSVDELAVDLALLVRFSTLQEMGEEWRPHLSVSLDGQEVWDVAFESFRYNVLVPVRITLDSRALSVTYNGAQLLHGLTLPSLQPAAGWEMAFAGSALSVADARVSYLHSNRGALIPVEVTLNLQDYTDVWLPYLFYDSPVLSAVCPASGPTAGGTRVVVHGAAFLLGPDLRCRFGEQPVAASLDAAAGTISCVSPSNMSTVGPTLLRISLNGQDYTPSTLPFAPHAPLSVDALSIDHGPTVGGSSLFVQSPRLHAGDDFRCRFGSTAHSVHGTQVIAAGARRAVRCVTPVLEYGPLVTGETFRTVALEISLNAQQYTNNSVGYTYYAPGIVSLLTPDSGWSQGGVAVVLLGSDLSSPAGHTHCRFGAAMVAASVMSPMTQVLCLSPPAVEAGTQSVLLLDFAEASAAAAAEAEAANYQLLGSAQLGTGEVSLTSKDYHQTGSLRLSPRRLPLDNFRLSFDAFVGDGTGGEGFSVCYGELPTTAFGRSGVGSGLCVRFATLDERAAVEYDMNNVKRREPKGAVQQVIELVYGGKLLQEFGAVVLLRPLEWSPVEVSCASGRVSVSYNRRSFFDAVHVDGYAPTDAWEIGIGASTGTWTDTHKLARVRLQLGAQVDRGDVVVELSSNGQQFVGSKLRFAYFPTPAVSLIWPESGPLSGHTIVALAGSGLAHGHSYRCAFNGTVVPATFVEESAADAVGAIEQPGCTVRCRSPPQPLAAPLGVSVSLNAQDYSGTADFFFTGYLAPRVHVLLPSSGPTLGGSRVLLVGEGFLGGDESTRLCRFGGWGATEAHVINDTRAACVAPAAAVERAVPVQIISNARDCFAYGPNFTYFEPPVLSQLAPSTGPAQGDTRITLYGNFSALGSLYACQFDEDEAVVPATRESTSELVCVARPLPASTSYYISVTLNGDGAATPQTWTCVCMLVVCAWSYLCLV